MKSINAIFMLWQQWIWPHSHVDTDHFNGYAKIRQKSIDLAFRYSYRLGVWGSLRRISTACVIESLPSKCEQLCD